MATKDWNRLELHRPTITHECTVDKLRLPVLKNLKQQNFLSHKSMIAQVAESRLEKSKCAHEKWCPVCPISYYQVSVLCFSLSLSPSLPPSLPPSLSQMAPSKVAAGPAQWLATVEAVPPVEDGLSGAAPAGLPLKGAPVRATKKSWDASVMVCICFTGWPFRSSI